MYRGDLFKLIKIRILKKNTILSTTRIIILEKRTHFKISSQVLQNYEKKILPYKMRVFCKLFLGTSNSNHSIRGILLFSLLGYLLLPNKMRPLLSYIL